MAAKRFPLPKRFNVAMSEKAYANLRALNAKTGLGNNYLLTFMLESLDDFADRAKLQRVFDSYIAEYGAPAPGAMKKAAPKKTAAKTKTPVKKPAKKSVRKKA